MSVFICELPKQADICEACDEEILSRILSGVEVERYGKSNLHLCQDCGLIDLELMQLCREMTIDCIKN